MAETFQEALARQAQEKIDIANRYRTGGFAAVMNSAREKTPALDFHKTYGGNMFSPLGGAINYTIEQRQRLVDAGIPLSLGETNQWYFAGHVMSDIPGAGHMGWFMDFSTPEEQNALRRLFVRLGVATVNEALVDDPTAQTYSRPAEVTEAYRREDEENLRRQLAAKAEAERMAREAAERTIREAAEREKRREYEAAEAARKAEDARKAEEYAQAERVRVANEALIRQRAEADREAQKQEEQRRKGKWYERLLARLRKWFQ